MLRLATGATAGTLSGIGSQFLGFDVVEVEPGATWRIAGDVAGLGGAVVLRGFDKGDAIHLQSVAATLSSIAYNGYTDVSTLTLSDPAATTLRLAGEYDASAFSLAADGSGGTLVSLTRGAGQYEDDDATLTIRAVHNSKREGTGESTSFAFIIERTGDTSLEQSVGWRAIGWTASGGYGAPRSAAADDFAGGTFPNGNITFFPGDTTKTILVDVAGDAVNESFPVTDENGWSISEIFSVELSAPSGGAALGVASSATSEIEDDDYPRFEITTPEVTQLEGDNSVTDFIFDISRSGNLSGNDYVPWLVSNGDPSDYVNDQPLSGNLYFEPGDVVKHVAIQISGDTVPEEDEFFSFEIVDPYFNSRMGAQGVILDDDRPPPPWETTYEGDAGSATLYTFPVGGARPLGGAYYTVHYENGGGKVCHGSGGIASLRAA